MAYAAWQATTSYAVGAVVRATTQQGFGFVFRCITAGTSGAGQPVWPTKLYTTSASTALEGFVVDGTVTWAAVSAVSEELQKVAPSAIIELFQLQLVEGTHYATGNPTGVVTTYYFHAGTNQILGSLTWGGQAYAAYPVQMEGFEYTGSGQLPKPKLTIANLDSLLTLALLEVNAITPGNDLINARVTRIRTLKKYIDAVNFTGGTNPDADPQAEFPREIYFISRKETENRNVITWELSSAFDMQGIRAPKRQAITLCQWVYKSAECTYAGGLPTCSKTLQDCEAHFGTQAILPFGGFPGVGQFQ